MLVESVCLANMVGKGEVDFVAAVCDAHVAERTTKAAYKKILTIKKFLKLEGIK